MNKMSLEELLNQVTSEENSMTEEKTEDNAGDSATDEGYGGNDSEDGGAVTYENGEWSGVIVESENERAPAEEEEALVKLEEPIKQETSVTEVSEKQRALERPVMQEAELVQEEPHKEVVIEAGQKEDSEPVAYLMVAQGEASISGGEIDVRLLAHLTTALVVVLVIGVMVICNLRLKPRRLKIAKVTSTKTMTKKIRKNS